MRRFFFFLCLLATPAVAEEPAAAPLAVIDGPTKTAAGEQVIFDAGGSTGTGYFWIVSSEQKTEGRWHTWEDNRFLSFSSPQPGTYRFTLSVALDNQSHAVEHVLQNGTVPDDEDPDGDDPDGAPDDAQAPADSGGGGDDAGGDDAGDDDAIDAEFEVKDSQTGDSQKNDS